jgi:hypothetical protein
MTKMQKMLTAAMAGLMGASMTGTPVFAKDKKASSGKDKTKANHTVDTHGCKGQNACKGKGGCSAGDNGCAGKNSCKGKGGCASQAATHECKGMNNCKGQGKGGENACKGQGSCKTSKAVEEGTATPAAATNSTDKGKNACSGKNGCSAK